MDSWRRLPFRDPGLPRELLSEGWSGPAAGALFEQLVATLERRALAHAAGFWPPAAAPVAGPGTVGRSAPESTTHHRSAV